MLSVWCWQSCFISLCFNLFLCKVIRGHFHHSNIHDSIPYFIFGQCPKSFCYLPQALQLALRRGEGTPHITKISSRIWNAASLSMKRWPAVAENEIYTHQWTHSNPRLNWICRQQLGDFDIRLNTIIQLVVALLPMFPLVRQFSLLEVKQPQPVHLKMRLFLFLLACIKEMTIWSTTRGKKLAPYCTVHVVMAFGVEKDSPRKYCLSKQASRVINRRGLSRETENREYY